MYLNKVDKTAGVLCDQAGKLSGFYVSKQNPDKLRKVKFIMRKPSEPLFS
jgi:hypothetical protein